MSILYLKTLLDGPTILYYKLLIAYTDENNITDKERPFVKRLVILIYFDNTFVGLCCLGRQDNYMEYL